MVLAYEIPVGPEFTHEERAILESDLKYLYSLPELDVKNIDPTFLTIFSYQFGGSPSGLTIKKFLQNKISIFLRETGQCGSGIIACAGMNNLRQAKSHVLIGDYYFKPDMSRVERISILIHEAKHNDGLPHRAICFGIRKCDDSVYSAFGAQFWFELYMLEVYRDDPMELQKWKNQIRSTASFFRGSAVEAIRQELIQRQLSTEILDTALKYLD